MKKLSFALIVVLLSAFSLYAAEVKRIDPAGNTQSVKSETLEAKPASGLFSGAVSKININLKTSYQKDFSGVIFYNEVGISTRQTLQDNFIADVYFRLLKPMSNDLKGTEIQLMKGTFQYAGPYFQLLAGRAETAKIFSTLNFFGPYAIAGQKYLDVIGATLPLFLTGGIPEIDEFKFPPMALSVYYCPTMFSLYHTDYEQDQALIIGQMRLNTIFFDTPVQAVLNTGKNTTEYFVTSIMSGEFSLESSFSFDLMKHYKVNLSGAILNTNNIKETSVIAGGLEIYNFKEWLFVIDKLIYEHQQSLNPDNKYFSFFISAENKIARFRYGLAISNTTNDFTLLGVKLIKPDFPYGEGNLYAPENITFYNTNNAQLNYYAYIGYEF